MDGVVILQMGRLTDIKLVKGHTFSDWCSFAGCLVSAFRPNLLNIHKAKLKQIIKSNTECKQVSFRVKEREQNSFGVYTI